jgi:hypothetical protein
VKDKDGNPANPDNDNSPMPEVGDVVQYVCIPPQPIGEWPPKEPMRTTFSIATLPAIVTGVQGRACNLRVFLDDIKPDERGSFPVVAAPQAQHARVPMCWRWSDRALKLAKLTKLLVPGSEVAA